ncbi:MAG: 3-phosphoshikimate 1-carboxyvinyltransferase, partial [Granulosicoccaceae bacterium]
FGPRQLNNGGSVKIRGDVSSQFTTGLLQCGPLMDQGLDIDIDGELISKPYVDMTISLMARFGVTVERDGWQSFHVAPGQKYTSPGEIYVEGDASSASYFLAAGLVGGGPVTVHGVGRDSIQGDVGFADALEAMGAQVQRNRNSIDVCAPTDLHVRAFDADFNAIPDAAMTLAVVAIFADGPCTLRNIASWRVKETDRLSAMATELGKLGIEVEEGEDWLRVHPGPVKDGVSIHTYDDHRIAMCFSLIAAAGVSVTIEDPDCTAKTFPNYFNAFAALTPQKADA